MSAADRLPPLASTPPALTRAATARMPTAHGVFELSAWVGAEGGLEQMVLSMGALGGTEPPLIRLHSECLTGDVFGSLRCDCGAQLDAAMAAIAAEGRGAVLYLRGHEGRGIGILHKLRAYALQDTGRDTVDANVDLGLPVDARDYGAAVQVLQGLGVARVRLITNNPAKVDVLERAGIAVAERVPSLTAHQPENAAYLATKARRMGHFLSDSAGD